jgi:hypothetical protein
MSVESGDSFRDAEVRDEFSTLAFPKISSVSSALCTEQCGEMATNERTPRFSRMLSVELNFVNSAWNSEQRAE